MSLDTKGSIVFCRMHQLNLLQLGKVFYYFVRDTHMKEMIGRSIPHLTKLALLCKRDS